LIVRVIDRLMRYSDQSCDMTADTEAPSALQGERV
jgi:hypothetical protein